VARSVQMFTDLRGILQSKYVGKPPHLRGEADVLGCATTSAPTGEDWNGDCGAEPAAGVCRSPEMKRNILFPGATGDLRASLLSAGLSVGDGMGDLQHRKASD
jgi:hypothetical protein